MLRKECISIIGFASDGDQKYFDIYIKPVYNLFSKRGFVNGVVIDPKKLIDYLPHADLICFFPDLLHLLKNMWRRLINEDLLGKEHILTFFVNMKKNIHIDANQDNSIFE